MLEAAELLPGAEAIAVSSRTGEGLDRAARSARATWPGRAPSRARAPGPPRLHIDRVFTIRGAGTVVTGTLWSGSIGRGDELVLLPSGRRVRVRARPGPRRADRTRRRRPARGGQPGGRGGRGDRARRRPRRGRLRAAADLPDRRAARVRATANPSTATAFRSTTARGRRPRGSPGSAARSGSSGSSSRSSRWPATALVIRQIAPPDTLGGGVVLDAHPKKHGPSRDALTQLERLARGEQAGPRERRTSTGAGGRPDEAGSRQRRPSGRLPTSALALEQRLKEAGLEPPLDSELDASDLAALREAGRAVRVSKSLHYHPDVLAEIRRPRDRPGRAQRRRDHARGAPRRARNLAEVRPGAARALRLREAHDPPRRRARAAPRPRSRL